MKWLLDTNVISESIKLRPAQQVIRWLVQIKPEDFAVSAVTMAELAAGIDRAPSQEAKERLQDWIADWADKHLVHHPLPLSHDVLVNWLYLNRDLGARGIARSAPDLLIAATARIYDLTIVTRNVRDFADAGVVVYDPWHDKTHRMDEP